MIGYCIVVHLFSVGGCWVVASNLAVYRLLEIFIRIYTTKYIYMFFRSILSPTHTNPFILPVSFYSKLPTCFALWTHVQRGLRWSIEWSCRWGFPNMGQGSSIRLWLGCRIRFGGFEATSPVSYFWRALTSLFSCYPQGFCFPVKKEYNCEL